MHRIACTTCSFVASARSPAAVEAHYLVHVAYHLSFATAPR